MALVFERTFIPKIYFSQ